MGVRTMKHAALLQAWSGRIATCRSSGKTVKEWCESEGISIKAYYYWEEKIVTEASQGAKLPMTALGNTLVRVNPDAMASGETAAIESAITIRHGESIITLPVGSSAEAVANLVKALNSHV